MRSSSRSLGGRIMYMLPICGSLLGLGPDDDEVHVGLDLDGDLLTVYLHIDVHLVVHCPAERSRVEHPHLGRAGDAADSQGQWLGVLLELFRSDGTLLLGTSVVLLLGVFLHRMRLHRLLHYLICRFLTLHLLLSHVIL